jgi:type IV pilus assembly protein PilY1
VDANTTQVSPLAIDVYLYKTHYNPDDWSGEIIAQKIDAKDGFGAELWRASENMPKPENRKIYTRSNNSGVPFIWTSLSPTLQDDLKGPGQLLSSQTAQKVLEYVRGSSANEGTSSGQFRPRHRHTADTAPLSPSPHNTPVYAKYGTSKTIFLGANDGMLHAFDADTGIEQFAYVPSALISRLALLTDGHNSFVDGEILITTTAQTPNRNLLVGALGRGGKGLYGLDVSNPAGFSASHVKWEFSSPQNCSTPDPNSAWLGNVIGSLAYAKVNDRPSAVFGNGYNSCSDKAALGVTDIENGNTAFIAVSNDTGNGLAPPHLRTNATTEKLTAYAGDLRGNMWKFDSISPADALAPKKLFAAGTNQPITARPLTAALNLTTEIRRVFVHFGTGRYLSVTDRNNTAQQSIYGLVDMDGSAISLNDLRKREFSAPGSVAGVLAKTILPLPSNPDMDTWKGWYIPLIETGERVVSSPIIVQTAHGDVAIFTTIIPAIGSDSCSAKGTGWLYVVNAQTGGALDFVFVDINGDGKFDDNDKVNGKIPSAYRIGDLIGGMPGQAKIVNNRLVDCSMDSAECIDLQLNLKRGENRLSWREIIH